MSLQQPQRGGKGNQRTRSYYGKDGIQRFHVKHIEPAVLEQAKQFLESFLQDLRIRQFLPVDRIESVCSREKLFVLPNEQRFEPGFLVFLPNQPPLFVQNRLQYGFALRMRVQPALYEQGTVLIGTMDTVHTTLRLEDVFVYSGKVYQRMPYQERFTKLQQFFRSAFVRDDKLSGCSIVCAEPQPLSALQDLVESGQYNSIDLLPDQGGRRRWHIPLTATARPEKESSREITPEEAEAQVPIFVAPVSQDKEEPKATEGLASKIHGLPDTMELVDTKGKSLGRAAVQTAELSMGLRKAFQGKPTGTRLAVRLSWCEDFGRYQIMGLQDS